MSDVDERVDNDEHEDEEPVVEPPPIKVAKISVEDVVNAIKFLKDHKGSSRASLLKYFKGKLDLESPEGINIGLKRACDEGVKSGSLVQIKQSFKVKGVEFEPPKDLTVVQEVLQPPTDSTDPPVKKGCIIDVAYEGRVLDSETTFDSSQAFRFEVGGGDVIKGWDVGVIGMRPGEQRRLTIPPKLGYGKRGSAPDIPPDATLVFDITLLKNHGD